MMRLLLTVTVLLVASACNNDAQTTATSPSPVVQATLQTEFYADTLQPGDLRFYSFSVPSDSTASAMLGSIVRLDGRVDASQRIGLGFGYPSGTTCTVTQWVVTTSGLTAQLKGWLTKGVHCVAIYDPGGMTVPLNFAVRFEHFF
ncbi:MAG: hypothetical protein FJW29_02555 [Acidobacteria bacterium]|nr:hypothetical protein [Acidobacteriota bacterium]